MLGSDIPVGVYGSLRILGDFAPRCVFRMFVRM